MLIGVLLFLGALGSGSASADNEWAGKTYEKAQQSLSGDGWKVEIATRQGEYLPLDKCIVTGSRRAPFRDSSGKRAGKVQLLDLNCNDTSASDGHPGNSVASPEGKAAAVLRSKAIGISKDYASAVAEGKAPACASESYVYRCKELCTLTGACSEELLSYLGL